MKTNFEKMIKQCTFLYSHPSQKHWLGGAATSKCSTVANARFEQGLHRNVPRDKSPNITVRGRRRNWGIPAKFRKGEIGDVFRRSRYL